MQPEKRSVWAGRALRALPFLVGVALAGALFAVFVWDLKHHGDGPRYRSRSDPWVALPVLAVWLSVLIPAGITWWRRRRSQSWPWAQTTIEGGSVIPVAQGRSRAYRLTVAYSYSVNGEEYGGDYTESFARESEAQGILKSLRDLPPPARYKPGDPSKSMMDPYRDAALAIQGPAACPKTGDRRNVPRAI